MAGPQRGPQGLEIPLAIWIDLVLPKQRILEIYLNIAEWGPAGQFGAEAGANMPSAAPPPTCRRAKRPAGRDPAQSGQAQRPQSRPRGAPAGRDLYGPGAEQADKRCWRQSRFLSHGRILNLALGHSISISRGLRHFSSRFERRASVTASATLLKDTDMAVPRRKTSPSRRGMRRSADALKKPTYAEDKDSGELRRPHHLDLKTGMYKGRQVLKAKKES